LPTQFGYNRFGIFGVDAMNNRRLSVLQKAARADVHADPFPFIVVRNALPEELYDQLAGTFPSAEQLGIDASENNVRWNYSAHQSLVNGHITLLWRKFIEYHTSNAFFQEIAELLQPEISALYPDRYPTVASLSRMRAGVRKRDKHGSIDVAMDAQIAGNTAVTEASSVRSTHVDQGNKIFSGLFYMRPKGYDAVGGDLTLSRFVPSLTGRPERLDRFKYAYVDDKYVEHVDTIKYDKNLLVLFINSLDSLHGVTVRQPTDQSRLFVNLVGEVSPPLYKLEEDGGRPSYLCEGGATPFAKLTRSVKRLFRSRRTASRE
jgi:hypothetical protein